MAKSVADNINAMHLAREAYIAGESDKKLKAALKQRIYKRGANIKPGDWIYFKNQDKWQGPVKVAARDGKSLYAVRGGRFLTINADHADIAMFEGEIVGKDDREEEHVEDNEPEGNTKTPNSPTETEKVDENQTDA